MTPDKSKKWVSKIVRVGLVALGIVAFQYFDLGQYLLLEYIKASQEKFYTLYLSHRFIVIAAYRGIYIAVTALSLPGAAVLTLAGGGLFGLIVGTVVVSFASSIGATLKLIVDHYPVKSIKDIGSLFKGPWDQPVVRLYGKTITLNHLEHNILRKRYSEPRIHMALVCAAKSCPQLRSEAYTTKKLDEQLNDQSRQYLVSPAGLNVNRKKKVAYFASIFKWYGEGFVANYSPTTGFAGLDKTKRAVANFRSAYLISADRDFLATGGCLVKYLDYDWSLNEK